MSNEFFFKFHGKYALFIRGLLFQGFISNNRPSSDQSIKVGLLTGLGLYNEPQSQPSQVPTIADYLHTIESFDANRIRSQYALDANPIQFEAL